MAILTAILNALLVLTSVFLICLILIQRGKGGGLAGAFGGMGGSSAFGTKAGDVFTKVTIWVALFWGLLAMILVFQSNRGHDSAWGPDKSASSKVKDSAAASGKNKKSSGSGAKGTADKIAPADKAGSAPTTDLPAAISDEPPPKPVPEKK